MAEMTIVVLATLDTKGEEADFLARRIRNMGYRALIIDAGVLGEPGTEPEISREEVAQAGGSTLADLLRNPSRETAAPVMALGATRIVSQLAREGKAHGMVAMGGTQGTTLCTRVMRELPYGFPKVMVSTMASGNVAPWVDIKDITMMFSVADIMGLNQVTEKILANAAGAVCGMAGQAFGQRSDVAGHDRPERACAPGEHAPLVAITTVGITTKGALKAREVLENQGFETIVFHAIGPGGRAMEQMMREGLIQAVLDYSTIEVSNHMYHALLDGGPDRLTTAGSLSLPQVLAPGAIEVLVFNEPDTVPPPFNTRRLVRHSPQITDVRLDAGEMREVGLEVARRLNRSGGSGCFMIPRGGFDSYDVEGGELWDPEADDAFVRALREGLPDTVELVEREWNIEDPRFAEEAARKLASLLRS